MNLSAEQYSTVIQSIEGYDPAGKDKRRAPRVVHRCRVPIVLDHGNEAERTVQITVRDLSPRGIGMLHNERIARGTPFIIQIERLGKAKVVILCTVAHCKSQGKDLFAIGAEFTCVLGGSDRAQPTAASATEDIARIRRSMLS